MAAALVVFPALSGAVPADPPLVVTGAATPVTDTTATLHGTVDTNDPDGLEQANYYFSYWTTNPAATTETQVSQVAAGTGAQPVSAAISGLAPLTTYNYKLCATNSAFPDPATCGTPKSFKTIGAPAATTDAATGITTSGATLNGTVNPNGDPTSAYFEWKPSSASSYNQTSHVSVGSGTAAVHPSTALTGLSSGANFTYHVCAANSVDTTCGSDQAFTTNAPPTARLVADKTSGPTPLAITFDGSGSSDPGGSIQSWSMTFGDGGTASGSGTTGLTNITHTYNNACNCNATLTVTDNQGAPASISVGIHVTTNQAPVAQLSVQPNSGSVPLAVSFDGSASADPDGVPLKSWTLDFLDGSVAATGTGPVPNAIAHTYTAPGVYNAKLTVVDSSNASSSKTVTVTVNPQPTISVADATVTEGGVAGFVVTLSAVSSHNINVDYKTSDGTATTADYTPTQGTLTINAGTCGPGTTACAINVPTIQDTAYEGTEKFTLTLSKPVNATILDGSATGTINDNDTPPILMIKNGGRLEGNAGSVINTSQSWAAGGSLTVADAGGLNPGQPFYLSIPGSHRSDPAGPYDFGSKTGNTLNNVTPAGSAPAGRIAFQLNTLTLTVLLCDASTPGSLPDKCITTTSGAPVTMQYTTRDSGVVKDGQDYIAECSVVSLPDCEGPVSPAVTIPAGQSSADITVTIIGNTVSQVSERSFLVELLSATNATIRWGLGTGDIIDDDAPNPPTATTGDVSSVGQNDATAGGTVNATGSATTAYVEFGKTTAYGSQTATQAVNGNTDTSLTFHLTGLAAGTTYHYRVTATHDSNHAAGYGVDKSFTTQAPPPPPPPPSPPPPLDAYTVTTGAATDVGTTVATIHGRVNPGLAATTVYVEYGRSDVYGSRSATQTLPAGSGDQVVTVVLKGLASNVTYHYRVIAVHAGEAPKPGADATLTTDKTPLITRPSSKKVTATTTGWVTVMLNCTGTAKPRCAGTVFLDYFGTPAGKAKFSILPGKHPVRVKLTRSIWTMIKKKRHLRVDVTTTTPNGLGEVNIDSRGLTIYAPKHRAPRKK